MTHSWNGPADPPADPQPVLDRLANDPQTDYPAPRHISYDEDTRWCQEHGHTGLLVTVPGLAGCATCDALVAARPEFAEVLGTIHNPDGSRAPRPSALAVQLAAASSDEIMAALRSLDTARWEDVMQRMSYIARWEDEPDDAYLTDRMDPADHAALVAPSGDPEVNRFAGLIMEAIHADMAAGLVPPDVGSFTALQDHRDANMYVIQLVDHPAPDCTCKTPPTSTDDVHEDECATRDEGGSAERWADLDNAVMDEVSRRLAVEAAADPRRPATGTLVPGSPLTEVPAPALVATPMPGGGVMMTPLTAPEPACGDPAPHGVHEMFGGFQCDGSPR
jgi:hypothetical protein